MTTSICVHWRMSLKSETELSRNSGDWRKKKIILSSFMALNKLNGYAYIHNSFQNTFQNIDERSVYAKRHSSTLEWT